MNEVEAAWPFMTDSAVTQCHMLHTVDQSNHNSAEIQGKGTQTAPLDERNVTEHAAKFQNHHSNLH